MSLWTVRFWEWQRNGVREGGQLRSWIRMENWGPMRGMYGTLDLELEVQRTIKSGAAGLSYVSSRKLSAPQRFM